MSAFDRLPGNQTVLQRTPPLTPVRLLRGLRQSLYSEDYRERTRIPSPVLLDYRAPGASQDMPKDESRDDRVVQRPSYWDEFWNKIDRREEP
jgi:hypothetical protein